MGGTDDAVRKTVTVLFADLVGSTALGETLDAESTREVLGEYHAMARSVIEEHGGFLAKFIGDGVMALFGVPETSEDDAHRAVATGVALQQAFAPLAQRAAERHRADLGLRVGLNTGEVVIASGDDDVVGDALNTAARLEAACTPGQVLVGEDTWRLTRAAFEFDALGSVQVRGKAEPIATYQVGSAGADDDELGTPFVGRSAELARLRDTFDEAVARQLARIATVIGAPGVGKTRLSREFCQGLGGDATVVEMRCRRSGTATFAPVADAVEVPPTIQSLLSARLDRMPPDERRLVELASVVGSEFPLGALQAVSDDVDGARLRGAMEPAVYELDQEDEARRELTLWWAPTLSPRRMEVSQLAVAFGESWVAPTTRPFGDLLAPDFILVDGRTLGLGELERDRFIQALVGREDDGTTGPPVPSRVQFVSDAVLVFRAANRGVTPGTEIEWEEIACNVFVTDGGSILRVEMFDEDRWEDAILRATAIAGTSHDRSD